MTASHSKGNAPTVADHNLISFPSCTFNTEAYGLVNSANDLVDIWKKLANNGFPLDKVSSMLNIADEPIEIIKTIDALECCCSIKGIEARSVGLKDKLSGIINQKHSTEEERRQKVLQALATTTDEFRIAFKVVRIGYPLEFRGKKGPDFRIGDKEIKLLEAKSRFNRKHFGGTSEKSATLYEKAIISLLCRDAFSVLEDVFDKQKAHIALVNLSHSEYGLLLAMHSLANNREFDLKKAVDDALALAQEDKQPVVMYVESSGGTVEYFGTTKERKIVDYIGRSLDRIENILRKGGKQLDFYDLAHIAQDPTGWLQRFKNSLGNS